MLVDPDFLDHWRVVMLCDQLDDRAPIYVLRLWSHCQLRRQDTFSMPADGIKAVCRYNGSAEELEAALIECGFLVRDGESVQVAGWAEKNAKLLAAWRNGSAGGRPAKETQQEPKPNPPLTNKSRVDKSRVDKSRKHEIDKVVDAYRLVHPRSRPGKKERRLIADRLGDGFSTDDLIAAIKGNSASPFHCGENENRKRYQTLELIVRDASKVQSFLELSEKPPAAAQLAPKNRRTKTAISDWIAQGGRNGV